MRNATSGAGQFSLHKNVVNILQLLKLPIPPGLQTVSIKIDPTQCGFSMSQIVNILNYVYLFINKYKIGTSNLLTFYFIYIYLSLFLITNSKGQVKGINRIIDGTQDI